MIDKLLNEDPLAFYDYMLLKVLMPMYAERQKTSLPSWLEYSNLLIDKFAIHSSSFFHLSSGIIEHKKSGEQIKMKGYDLFTVNSVFRTIIETYITFHHLFVEPSSEEEKKIRFLLWKIDGLFEKKKFDISESVLNSMQDVILQDEQSLEEAIVEFESSPFYQQILPDQMEKIYNPKKKKVSWRFTISEGKVRILKISELVAHLCKTSAFRNTYRYTSIHTHSNYWAIETFRQKRGKVILNEYTDPLTRLAIYLTCMMIHDLAAIDDNARNAFKKCPIVFQDFVKGITKAIKES